MSLKSSVSVPVGNLSTAPDHSQGQFVTVSPFLQLSVPVPPSSESVPGTAVQRVVAGVAEQRVVALAARAPGRCRASRAAGHRRRGRVSIVFDDHAGRARQRVALGGAGQLLEAQHRRVEVDQPVVALAVPAQAGLAVRQVAEPGGPDVGGHAGRLVPAGASSSSLPRSPDSRCRTRARGSMRSLPDPPAATSLSPGPSSSVSLPASPYSSSVPSLPRDRVVAGAAADAVPAEAAGDHVVARGRRAARRRRRRRRSCRRRPAPSIRSLPAPVVIVVVAAAAADDVVAAVAVDRVVAAQGDDHVVAGGAVERLAGGSCRDRRGHAVALVFPSGVGGRVALATTLALGRPVVGRAVRPGRLALRPYGDLGARQRASART